jgi:hypothetical protein
MLATQQATTVARSGQTSFERVEGTDITAFNLLTEEDIVAWVLTKLTDDAVTHIKESLMGEIAQLTLPKTTATGVPWQVVSESE